MFWRQQHTQHPPAISRGHVSCFVTTHPCKHDGQHFRKADRILSVVHGLCELIKNSLAQIFVVGVVFSTVRLVVFVNGCFTVIVPLGTS